MHRHLHSLERRISDRFLATRIDRYAAVGGNIECLADLLAATRFLDTEYEAPALLLGHSLGGTAVLQAAHSIPSAVAVASIGSPELKA